MSFFNDRWPNLDDLPIAAQARALADELRLYRDLRYGRGSSASYQLTVKLAQLPVAGALIGLSPSAHERLVRDLINDSRHNLRCLQGQFDA